MLAPDRKAALDEVHKKPKHPIYAQIDEPLYWKLKDILNKRRMKLAEWIEFRIKTEA